MSRAYWPPPPHPKEGQRWKVSNNTYRWQAGRGWVAASLYQEPQAAEPAKDDRAARLLAGLKAHLRATNAHALTLPDDGPLWRLRALAGALAALVAALVAKATPEEPICEGCGGPRSIYSVRLCRSCYVGGLKQPKPAAPPPVCSDCGGPRSASSGGRCKGCHMAYVAAERARQRVDHAEAAIERARVAATPPRPEPERKISVPALRPAAPPAPLPPPPTAAPIGSQSVEVSAPGWKPAPDPRGRRARKAPPPPDFPPEFLERLRRVGAGEASIVEVRPVRSADPEGGMSSSLGFD